MTPLLIVAASVAASAAVIPADPDAALAAARAAVAKTGAIEYRASLRTEGPMSEAFGRIDGARVIIGAPHGARGLPVPRPFIIQGELRRGGGSMPLAASFDGTTVLALVPSERAVLKQTLEPGGGFAMVEAYELLMPGYGAIPLEGRPNAQIRDGGMIEVDGNACEVVEVVEISEVPPQPQPNAPSAYELIRRIALDVDDRLPRRSEAVFTPLFGDRRGETNRIIVELSGGYHQPAELPKTWAIEAPEGWRLIDADAPQRQFGPLSKGTEAPTWTLKDASGADHALADLRGRVVVLDFWATWCGPCKRAMPGMQRLHDQFAGKPVTVIGISTFERGGDPAAYMAKQGFSYLGLVMGDRVARDYGVSSIPHLYVIAQDGTVAFQAVGFTSQMEHTLTGVIESLLQE